MEFRITKNSKLNNYQKQFILDNYKTMSNEEISKTLNLPKKLISSYAKGNHLIKNQNVKAIKHGIYKEIVDKDFTYLYDSMFKQVEPKIDSSLLYKSKYGKYHINQNYFDVIDNEWKAYWLGFAYADGCNNIKFNKKKNKMEHLFKISLCKADESHLNKFKDSLQTDSPIKERDITLNNKKFKSTDITICNRNICESLNSNGCVPNKSLILKFPDKTIVPDELIRHFIRGYFDGDGCVHVNLDNKASVINFVGTKEFLEKVQEVFHKEIELPYTKIVQKSGQKSYQLTYGGIEEFVKIFIYLYKDSNICLQRKLDKFKLIL